MLEGAPYSVVALPIFSAERPEMARSKKHEKNHDLYILLASTIHPWTKRMAPLPPFYTPPPCPRLRGAWVAASSFSHCQHWAGGGDAGGGAILFVHGCR